MFYIVTFCLSFFFFFFSSRRRHTRCSRDWSSDVCSSDLEWVLLQRAYKVPQMHQSYSHLLARHKRAHVVVKARSEEHTSELQSRLHLVCRLLLEKKKKKTKT